MTTKQKFSLFFLRVSLGVLMLYAGITKVVNPAWSAEGYIKGAKTFAWFYQWLFNLNILPVINFLNEWGLMLLGISLIFGIFVRLSSSLGIVLMLLYYCAALDFPYPDTYSFIVDQHVIYIGVLGLFIFFRAGRVWGLDRWISNKFHRLQKFT